jgi:hypothetical protein
MPLVIILQMPCCFVIKFKVFIICEKAQKTRAKKYFQNQQALVIVLHEKCDTYTQNYRHFSGVFNLVT